MPTRPPTQPGAPTVLVVDDEPPIVDSLQKIFERESLRVLTAGSGGEALEILRREPVSVLLTDLMMPGMSGMDLLRASKSIAPETETVLMTAYGTVENAVEAMKQGAYDFVTKPIKRAHLVRVVGKAIEKRSLVQENRSLRAQLAAEQRRALIGQSLRLASDDGDRHAGGAVAGDGAAAGRVGHRQGAAGARDPRQLAARGRPVRAGQLRRAARDDPGGGAVRIREGGLHRRDPAPRRPVRAGRRRHAVSRRDRRDPDARPGEALARAAGGGGRAARRADLEGGSAAGGRHQSGPARRRARGALPRGSLLPPQRHRGADPAAARSRATTSRFWPSTSCSGTPRATTATCRGFRAPPRRRWPVTSGRATCASWRTPSSAPWCSRAAARSRSTICRPRCAAAAASRATGGRSPSWWERRSRRSNGGSFTPPWRTSGGTSASARSSSASPPARSTGGSRRNGSSPSRPPRPKGPVETKGSGRDVPNWQGSQVGGSR